MNAVLFQGFPHLELRNNNKCTSNSVVSAFTDSGAGLVLYITFLRPSIEQQKQAYNCETNSVVVVYNEWTNCLYVYRHLLTNRLHGKAAELCLANS